MVFFPFHFCLSIHVSLSLFRSNHNAPLSESLFFYSECRSYTLEYIRHVHCCVCRERESIGVTIIKYTVIWYARLRIIKANVCIGICVFGFIERTPQPQCAIQLTVPCELHGIVTRTTSIRMLCDCTAKLLYSRCSMIDIGV